MQSKNRAEMWNIAPHNLENIRLYEISWIIIVTKLSLIADSVKI
jgi:hypothetical protein